MESAGHPNGTAENATLNSFYFYETEQFAVMWILFIAIVFGNSSVITVIICTKTRKNRMNFFIKHLAIADLFVGLICVLTDIVWRMTISWYAGNLACKFIRFTQAAVTYASTYVLVALTIDRYDAITNPMNIKGSWRQARTLVVAAWTLSCLFSAPILLLYEERVVEGRFQCWIEFGEQWHWKLYMSLVALTVFVLPAAIIATCYIFIVSTIWRKSIADASRTNRDIAVSSRGIIPRAKIKTIKITSVIVSVFVACWCPYMIFDVLQAYGLIERTQANVAVATLVQSLAPLNSAANPLVYYAFSERGCRQLARLASRPCRAAARPPAADSATLSDTLTYSVRRGASHVRP